MRNYNIKHSKRNIKKVFKRVFGEVYVTLTIHSAKDYGYRKPTVGLMRYMLICHWH
jgi:hypothetical protein